jgi:hypothetical protein
MAQTAKKQSRKDHEAKRTDDHDTIRRWAEERDGSPAVVEGTEILRFDFDDPDGSEDEALQQVSWEEFFEVFNERSLEFLYQEYTREGNLSRFNKFVKQGSEEEDR